jgi:Nucleotidyltransferase domain
MTDAEREALLKAWTLPPSDSEDQRAENACRVVTNAVKNSPELAKWNIEVFIQGSYRNNTNVRLQSDVDVCVCLNDTITTDYSFAPGRSDTTQGIVPAKYPYSQFKNDLQQALINAFGASNVKRGNKAFNIKENSYRVTADVVPCLEHRRYNSSGGYVKGTSLWPDNGSAWIHNFPAQHYSNGVGKNKETSGYFKDTVRIMKNLRNRMDEQGIASAKPIASFFNECLVWNTPNAHLVLPNWNATIRETLVHLWVSLESEEKCAHWGQVSEMLYLFRGNYSRADARVWVQAAWNWLDYK